MPAHRRYNPLLDEWVLVSPERTQRPWQGHNDAPAPPAPAYDSQCYLCPGNPRAHGLRNPVYDGVYVFENDFPALSGHAGAADSASPLLRSEPETGICRVVCYSPRHDLTLGQLPPSAVAAVVEAWTEQYRELSSQPDIAAVMIFENRGAMMGASNPHPHGQIWANAHLPNVLEREQRSLARRHCLLCEYVALETARRERVVCENEAFVAVVPFWANWPFEVLLLPRRHAPHLAQLTNHERAEFANILRQLFAGYDRLFDTAFPNSWGLHQLAEPAWHLHAHFFPPLLRSATVRKFMVGYELLAMPQRDLTAEEAAARLRAVLS